MKKILLMISLLMTLLVGGCGSDALLIGGGAAGGSALTHTISGYEKDLEQQEQRLIELYNQGVEQGMEKERLDEIEQDIKDTRLLRQTTKTGKEFLGVNWDDPSQAGTAVGSIISIALLWMRRKEQKKAAAKDAGINKFSSLADPDVAKKLYDTIKSEVANL